MKRIIGKIGKCAVALALAVGVLAGCAGNAVQVDSAQQANRDYMSQVNAVMSDLGTNLESFVDAVARGDVVNMKTQADDAYKLLDTLSGIEAPEELGDIQQNYVDGTAKLKEALDAYIALYSEIDSGSFNQADYASRIGDIQNLYDEGVNLLKQGDEAAASKQ